MQQTRKIAHISQFGPYTKNGEISVSLTDVCESCPSRKSLEWQVCLLTLFVKIKLPRKIPNLHNSIFSGRLQFPHFFDGEELRKRNTLCGRSGTFETEMFWLILYIWIEIKLYVFDIDKTICNVRVEISLYIWNKIKLYFSIEIKLHVMFG